MTPLLEALTQGIGHYLDALQCMSSLLKSGADPTVSTRTHRAPIMYAMNGQQALATLWLTEGAGYFDPTTFEDDGMDLWLFASGVHGSDAILNLQKLLDLGCKTTGTDHFGRNCLFQTILASRDPSDSRDFERLQFLLGVFDDIYAQDEDGCTIFDLVQGEDHCTYGSYRCDLWYCALERAGIDVSHHLADHPRKRYYKTNGRRPYTPEHYHALKHLQSWDHTNFRSQMDRLLQDIPLGKRDAELLERIRDLERSGKDGSIKC